MVNWAGLANRKYEIMAQQADAGSVSASAQARNAATSASLAPASIQDTQASAALRQAQAAEVPMEGQSQRDLRQSQSRLNMAQAAPVTPEAALGAQVFMNRGAFEMPDLSQFPLGSGGGGMAALAPTGLDRNGVRVSRGMGFAKGTARVPGKGSGKVDSVPAKLAPGEAVLNKEAAETLGRGLISMLNQHGAQKMGLV